MRRLPIAPISVSRSARRWIHAVRGTQRLPRTPRRIATAGRAPRPALGVYDRRAHERLIDELIATFRPGQPVGCTAAAVNAAAVHLRHVSLGLDARGADPGRALARRGGRRARVPAVAGAHRARAVSGDDARRSRRRSSKQLAARYLEMLAAPVPARRARHRQAAGQLPVHRPHQGAVPGREDRAHDARSARQLPVDLLPASRSRHELRARSRGHRALLRAVPPPDGALEDALRRRHLRSRLRRAACASRAPPSSG